MSWIDESIKALKEKESPLTPHGETCLQMLEALKTARKALLIGLDTILPPDKYQAMKNAIEQIDNLGK